MNPVWILAAKIVGAAMAQFFYMKFEQWLGRTNKFQANSVLDLGPELVAKFLTPKEKPMDAPSPASKPIVDVLNLVCDGINLGMKIAADKGLSVTDLSAVLAMMPDVGPAVSAIHSLPAAIASLSPADAAAIEAGVVAQLNIPSAQGKIVVAAIFEVLVKLDALYQAIKPAPAAPVAPSA